MGRWSILAPLIGAFAFFAAVPAAAQLERHRLNYDGHSRSYALVQSAPAQQPRPLVLVLHGAGGDARGMEALTAGRWTRIAQTKGWLVAYPEAIGGMWDTDGGKISQTLRNRTDDGGFLGAVIDDIARRHAIDETRVFATGFSRGAQASFLAACKLPGRIRAIAPVAMAMPVHLGPECKSGPPVGVFMITGTSDPFVPPETGPVLVGGQERDTMFSPQDTATHWRARNGCSDSPLETTRIDAIPDDGTALAQSSWPACTPKITSIRIENGGHSWPSDRRRSLFRTPSREIDATGRIWAFFSSFE